MFRALLWKEWRQLALIRWGGVALGAVLPIAFTAGAELAQRGLLPTGTVKTYAPRDLMYELLPAALAFGLWPLIGLISVIQAFTGDRANGTEAFLLERPVPRGRTWRARLTAALLTLLVVIAGTAAIAAAAAKLAGAPPSVGWLRWIGLMSAGVVLGLLAYLGGLIAASVLSSPLGALLLGAILGALPVLLAAQLSAVFLYARVGEFFLGLIVPIVVLPAFVAASWLAFCRGEPAGSGRVRRALTTLGIALFAAIGLFVVFAPVVVRADARTGQHTIQGSPTGRRAFVGSSPGRGWGAGWLVDVATGAKREFIPPPVSEVAWSPDGSELAILTWSAPMGGVRDHERIDIRSAEDGRVLRSIPIDEQDVVDALSWAKDGLIIVVGEPKRTTQRVEVIDPMRGVRRDTGFRSQNWSMTLSGPFEDGRVFVRRTVVAKASDNRTLPRGFQLRPVDVAAARVGPALTDALGSDLTFAGWPLGLSRSGRLARIVDPDDDSGASHIVDLRPGAAPIPRISTPAARWIANDRLVWLDDLGDRKRLFIGTPGEPPKALREWRAASVGLEPSPDGRAVFVSVLPGEAAPVSPRRTPPDPAFFEGEVPVGATPEELIYLPDDDRFASLGAPFSDRRSDQRYTQWAGDKTLARIALGAVSLEDIDKPGSRRYVIR